jgi:zinc transport system ATP-binding protein
MEKKEIIRFENVNFSYTKKEFLENISFSVYDKDFIGIIGPNGGGKTTILKLMLGLLKPNKGKIRIYNKNPKKERKDIGYLSQFKNIDFDFPITVYEIVELGRIENDLFKKYTLKDKKAVEKILKELKIYEYRNKNLNELSGGQKQRVFVARALVNNPKILILDEPMSNLDIHIKEEFYKILQKLNKNITIIVVDHDLDMLSKYAKEIVCVNKCNEKTIKYHDNLKLKNV